MDGLALAVLGAVAIIAGPAGHRTAPVESFASAPGETLLRQGELVVALRIPPPKPRSGAAYLRFTPRREMDLAVAGVAAIVELSEDLSTVVLARVALGAVAPTVLMPRDVGDCLANQRPSEQAYEQAASLAAGAVHPISDVRGSAAQRRHLAGVLTKRALRAAVQRARGDAP